MSKSKPRVGAELRGLQKALKDSQVETAAWKTYVKGLDELSAVLRDDLNRERINSARQRERLQGLDKLNLELFQRPELPIPMLLTCPACHERHIDTGAWAIKLHRTHSCQNCGMVWRPALVPTVGVQHLPGYKNPE